MNNEYYIEINASKNITSFDDIKVQGEFRVNNEEISIQYINENILKHIVLVVTRSASYQSVTPFSDIVVFKDDVTISSDNVSGLFNISIKDHISFNGKGKYYIMCSLGTMLSNTLKITI